MPGRRAGMSREELRADLQHWLRANDASPVRAIQLEQSNAEDWPGIGEHPQLILVLDEPMSTNNLYASIPRPDPARRGGVRIVRRMRIAPKRYKNAIAIAVLDAVPADYFSRESCLAIEFVAYFDSIRRDLDNAVKLAQDAIMLGLGLNDWIVSDALLHKRVDPADPRLEVRIVEIADPGLRAAARSKSQKGASRRSRGSKLAEKYTLTSPQSETPACSENANFASDLHTEGLGDTLD